MLFTSPRTLSSSTVLEIITVYFTAEPFSEGHLLGSESYVRLPSTLHHSQKHRKWAFAPFSLRPKPFSHKVACRMAWRVHRWKVYSLQNKNSVVEASGLSPWNVK